MALVSSVITDAYRETNLISAGKTPTTTEYSEGLTRLQNLVSSVLGYEAGENLLPLALPNRCTFTHLPTNSRLMLNLTASLTNKLDPSPCDGARMAVIDVGNNLATHNVILDGNGRQIEGAATLTLSTNGLNREWFYRGDLGNWVRVNALTLTGAMPFPTEFDDMFVIMLAMRLNPRNGRQLSGESVEAMKRSMSQFKSRYLQKKEVSPEAGLLRLSTDRRNGYYDFSTGETP